MAEEEIDEESFVSIMVKGKEESYPLLKDIQEKCNSFIEDLRVNKKKALKDYRDIIFNIETSSTFNYYFLKYLKNNNISYKEGRQKWDYKKNFEMLKETLTNKHFKLLGNKRKRPNPLDEITNILQDYLQLYDKKVSKKKDPNASQNINKNIKDFFKKHKLEFQKLNFPLITGIERLRLKYYRDLILEKDITTNCGYMKKYIMNMKKDKDIFKYSIDQNKFNPKTYLFILTITVTFNGNKDQIINNFFLKDILEDDDIGIYKNITRKEKGKYLVETKYEKKYIDGKNYILSGLDDDLSLYKYLPLDLLLLRNESYKKFQSDGGKGFLYQLGLYDSFISYFKSFIQSKAVTQLLDNNEDYHNIKMLLSNQNFINDMLTDNHFRFLPFYGSKKFFGYTNKDLMMSFINSIPEVSEDIMIRDDYQDIQNLYHISLLYTTGVKFVTSLHEFIIHLVYSYLYYFSSQKLDSISFKEDIDDNDDGFCFERLLKGKKRFNNLDLNAIIVLLDGISCEKNLSEFQKDLNAEIEIKDLIKKCEKGKGFLKFFLEKYPINFDYFENNKMPIISCRGYNASGIDMTRNEPDSCGGRRAKK